MILTYKYRLLPTRSQHAAMVHILDEQRQFYNAALEERIGCYQKTGRTINYRDQQYSLTEWRKADPNAALTPLKLQRWTLRRVDDAYKAFFRRMKAKNGKAGFPRFRGKARWSSFGFSEFMGVRFDGKRLRWQGLPGGLRVRMHRPLPDSADIRSCVFRHDQKGWSVCFAVRVDVRECRQTSIAVGLDAGLTHLATLSTGEHIPNPQHARRAERELRKRQRALARCKRGSARRGKVRTLVTRLHRKVQDTRQTYLHQVSADLTRRFGLIAVEKLNVRGMVRSSFGKSIHDASWGTLLSMLRYKAEWAGGEVIEVNPRNTSQACSGCGVIVPKKLSDRMHSCPDCGLVLDRDHNAALNILRLAVAGQGVANVAECGKRSPGNIMSRAA